MSILRTTWNIIQILFKTFTLFYTFYRLYNWLLAHITTD